MLISKAARQAYVDREFESFLWMKKLQRDRLLQELRTLRVRPKFKTDPWLHQLVCFWIGLHYPRFLFLLDMGAGKSKILMDIITQLVREKRLTKQALITVPRLINMGSWEEDMLLHSNLEPVLCSATSIEQKWEQLITADGDVSVIDYQGLCLATCDVKRGKMVRNDKKVQALRRKYGFMGMDECHKLGNPDSLWHSLVWQISKEMEFAYGTTGTLFGKDPEPAWAQFKLIDHGETFGENMGLFRATFYDQKAGPWRIEREFRRAQMPLLNRMLQHRSIRYNEREFSDVPLEHYIPVVLRMAQDQRDQYLLALEGLIQAGGSLQKTDSAYIRMRQLCSGFLSWKDEHGKHMSVLEECPKLDAVERLLDECPDEKWVISTEYTGSGQLVSQLLTRLKLGHVWLYGGSKGSPLDMRKQFMEDESCRVFLMQSDSGGTGVDGLQKVCKRLIFYETPTSPTARRQVIKRVVRAGQKERAFIYDLTMKGSAEVGVLEDAKAGIDFYNTVVDGSLGARLKNLFFSA